MVKNMFFSFTITKGLKSNDIFFEG